MSVNLVATSRQSITSRSGELLIKIVGRVSIMLESGKEEGVVSGSLVASATV